MCRSMIYDPSTAEYICLETGEVFGDRIVGLVSLHDWQHYSADAGVVKLRRRRLVREIYRLAALLELGEQTIRQAVALSQRVRSDPRPVRITALALLYISDRLLHGTPPTLFCRKMRSVLRMRVRIECRRFVSLCMSVASELGIKLDGVEVDCTHVILKTASLITDNDYLKAEIVRRAKGLYDRVKMLYAGSRYYIAIACVIHVARELGLKAVVERICSHLNASREGVRHALRWMKKHQHLLSS